MATNSTDTYGEDPLPVVDEADDKRDQPEFWENWIQAAREAAARTHWADAGDAWDEYENRSRGTRSNIVDTLPDIPRPYPIYWASTKTLEPAYYSRTPKLIVKRNFGIDDPDGILDCHIIRHLGDFLMSACDFDEVAMAAVGDFIHADKASIQVCYEAEMMTIEEPISLIKDGEEYYTEDGELYEDEVVQYPALEGEEPTYVGAVEKEVPKTQDVFIAPLVYDEVLHTPNAKCQREITEMAYHFLISKEDAAKRFGVEKAKKINWKRDTGRKEDKGARTRNELDDAQASAIIGDYVEGWECHCKATKKSYWLSKQYADGFLDVKDDVYGLRDFFPSTKFIISSKPSKSLYPTPIFAHMRQIISELHDEQNKLIVLIDAVRRRAIVDGDEDLALALNMAGNAEFVSVKNLQNIIEKGGLQNMIWYLPVEELVNAISELSNLQEKFKNDFFEWFGVPDILRGATDPIETATAQQIKSHAAHDRFKYNKKLVQKMVSESISMMIDLALGVFTDEKLSRICGFDLMNEDEQQRFPIRIQALRDDWATLIRFDIDTDSMTFIDDHMQAQKVTQTISTLMNGLDKISQMVKAEGPEYAAVGLQALLMSLEVLSPGKEFEETARKSVESLIQKANNPPPPPPDYEKLKIEVRAQENSIEAFAEQAKAAAKQRELEQKEMKLALDAQRQVTEAQDKAADNQLDWFKAKLEESVQNVMVQFEGQRVVIEQQRFQLDAMNSQVENQEKMMEEGRLATDTKLETLRILLDSQQPAAEAQPVEQPQPIVVQAPPVNVYTGSGAKRRGKITYDEMGNAEMTIEEDLPEEVL